ncbi:MAG TPA: hypothetical protein VG096_02130 [Bryobacteraceae bacterium]|jgi:hemolysin-activating ACP:hemolysin acyltransferase|nr:hypothetical protein [Bryobacteraceae bacterium]
MKSLLGFVIVLTLSAMAHADVIVSSGYFDLTPNLEEGQQCLAPGSAARTQPFPGRRRI